MKKKIGVALDSILINRLEDLLKELATLHVSRSELIEAILSAYFRSKVDHVTTAREFVLLHRQRKLI